MPHRPTLYRHPHLLSVLLLLLLILSFTTVSAQDELPFFEEGDCLFPAIDGVICGFLIVPEDRSQPEGSTVELAVAIIEPYGANPDPVPVIYLEGGPGGAPLISVDTFLTEPILENHTLILFDQRGTGFSLPSLNCPELEAADEGDDGNPVEACRDRLQAEGIDLQMYNSANSAADVYDLATALGYDTINLWGISYGTKLGLTVMRDYPEIVQSAVLDSVYAPEVDDFQNQTTAALSALNALFESCAADSVCGEAYPDLENDFYTMLDQFDTEPVEIDMNGELVTLDGSTIYNSLFTTLYNTQALPFLPYGISLLAYGESDDDLAAGYAIISDAEFPVELESPEPVVDPVADSEEVLSYIDEYGQIDDSEGMAYSVDCQEEYQLNDVDSALALVETAPAPLSAYFTDSINSSLSDCDIWNVETADPIEAERVISDVPTLLFAGSFDPITPVASAESALQGLSNGQLMIFPAAGHGITFTQTDSGACAKDIMLAFLDDPGALLDSGCIDATSTIEFYVE